MYLIKVVIVIIVFCEFMKVKRRVYFVHSWYNKFNIIFVPNISQASKKNIYLISPSWIVNPKKLYVKNMAYKCNFSGLYTFSMSRIFDKLMYLLKTLLTSMFKCSQIKRKIVGLSIKYTLHSNFLCWERSHIISL